MKKEKEKERERAKERVRARERDEQQRESELKLDRARMNSLDEAKRYAHLDSEQENETGGERKGERDERGERCLEKSKWTDGAWMHDLKLLSNNDNTDKDMEIIWDCG